MMRTSTPVLHPYCWLAKCPQNKEWCRTTFQATEFDTEEEADAAMKSYTEHRASKCTPGDPYDVSMMQRLHAAEIVSEIPSNIEYLSNGV